jgi:hypothetical protein
MDGERERHRGVFGREGGQGVWESGSGDAIRVCEPARSGRATSGRWKDRSEGIAFGGRRGFAEVAGGLTDGWSAVRAWRSRAYDKTRAGRAFLASWAEGRRGTVRNGRQIGKLCLYALASGSGRFTLASRVRWRLERNRGKVAAFSAQFALFRVEGLFAFG